MFEALGVFFHLIKMGEKTFKSSHRNFEHLISRVEFLFILYLVKTDKCNDHKTKELSLGYMQSITPWPKGEGRKESCVLIYPHFIKSRTIEILRWSTRYSWLNRCDSSEYYCRKAALAPRRNGLTDELLKKWHLTERSGKVIAVTVADGLFMYII